MIEKKVRIRLETSNSYNISPLQTTSIEFQPVQLKYVMCERLSETWIEIWANRSACQKSLVANLIVWHSIKRISWTSVTSPLQSKGSNKMPHWWNYKLGTSTKNLIDLESFIKLSILICLLLLCEFLQHTDLEQQSFHVPKILCDWRAMQFSEVTLLQPHSHRI